MDTVKLKRSDLRTPEDRTTGQEERQKKKRSRKDKTKSSGTDVCNPTVEIDSNAERKKHDHGDALKKPDEKPESPKESKRNTYRATTDEDRRKNRDGNGLSEDSSVSLCDSTGGGYKRRGAEDEAGRTMEETWDRPTDSSSRSGYGSSSESSVGQLCSCGCMESSIGSRLNALEPRSSGSSIEYLRSYSGNLLMCARGKKPILNRHIRYLSSCLKFQTVF